MEILDTPPSGNSFRNPNDILTNGYTFSIGDAISEGFEIFKQKMGEFVGFTVLFIAILGIASFIPFASVIVSGALTVGFYIMAHNIKTCQSTDFNVFFKGFDKIGQLILFSLVSSIFIVIGIVLLVLPGIYLAVAYSIGLLFVTFYNLEFWDSMEWSRKIVTKQWWKFLGFMIVLAFFNLAGLLALGIGVLFTIPISYCATYAMFDQITKVSGRHDASLNEGGSTRDDGHAGDGYRR